MTPHVTYDARERSNMNTNTLTTAELNREWRLLEEFFAIAREDDPTPAQLAIRYAPSAAEIRAMDEHVAEIAARAESVAA